MPENTCSQESLDKQSCVGKCIAQGVCSVREIKASGLTHSALSHPFSLPMYLILQGPVQMSILYRSLTDCIPESKLSCILTSPNPSSVLLCPHRAVMWHLEA